MSVEGVNELEMFPTKAMQIFPRFKVGAAYQDWHLWFLEALARYPLLYCLTLNLSMKIKRNRQSLS